MKEAEAPKLLRSWRSRHGLTVREAGALIVIDGTPSSGATWHAWETGKKIPKPAAMVELELLTGIEPGSFYPRPDAGGTMGALQPALL